MLGYQLDRVGMAVAVTPDDMPHDDLAGADAVGVDVPRIAADAIEEALHHALRVVETPRTGPTVGPREDRVVAVGFDDSGGQHG